MNKNLSSQPLIEPLESRIAPASVYLAGKPTLGDITYTSSNTPFHTIDSKYQAELGSVPHGYYIALHAGDVLKLYNVSTGYQNFVKVNKGTAVAFFVDKTGSGNVGTVDSNELEGISLSTGADVQVFGAVHGDIVTNLADNLSLDTNLDGRTIARLDVTGGSVEGNIIAGGSISNLHVVGHVVDVLTGTAANGVTYKFAGGGGQSLFATTAAGVKGPNLTNSIIGDVDLIQMGDGGVGAAGGSINNFTLVSDTTGFTVKAGNGGSSGGAFANGGAGGAVKNFFANGPQRADTGFSDKTPNDTILVQGGLGGDASGTGKGGAGGALQNVNLGYRLVGTTAILSDDFVRDNVTLHGGIGGGGINGGAGGSLTNVKVATLTPDAVGDEIQLLGGLGGSATGGKAGKGGAITNYDVRNQNVDATGGLDSGLNSSILVHAGDAGSVSGTGTGANGGNVTTGVFVGANVFVYGGNGSSGAIQGGKGGAINTVTVRNVGEGIANTDLELFGGQGGDSDSGIAGAGGGVLTVKNLDANLRDINTGDAQPQGFVVIGGKGGNGSAKGGAGGTVSSLQVTDSFSGYQAAAYVQGGNGGDAKIGNAGKGGGIQTVAFSGSDVDIAAIGGTGGGSLAGNGGKGGSISNAGLYSAIVNFTSSYGYVAAGNGGSGSGTSHVSGAGGSALNVNLGVDGNAQLLGGTGGAGLFAGAGSARMGAGGSVKASSAISATGSVLVTGGNAGATGVLGAAGGLIDHVVAQALGSIQLGGGNGYGGGAGGNVSNIGFSGSTSDLTPLGVVYIQAGAGSASGSVAGKGGSVSVASGYAGLAGTTVLAGSVAGGATVGAAGGNVSGLDLVGGGGNEIVIQAGDGSAANIGAGGKGGSVSQISIAGSNMNSGSFVRVIAAGNGADGITKSGAGGSVSDVNVDQLSIGIMDGHSFGYSDAGGIFAGVGGSGALNGNVQNVTAYSIASIVAGRTSVPQLANTVNAIFLQGNHAPMIVADGGDANFGHYFSGITNYNTVGSSIDSTAMDAAKFQFGDANGNHVYDVGEVAISGLIAAKTLTAKRNFTPGAYLNDAGLIDFNA